ncbi:hypothetical protein [Botrimarina sp.]|uniref:hypothetical protein n=1 Tax=Botrimarina sp. TaxID=2795802 RepID=UPI0032EC59BE
MTGADADAPEVQPLCELVTRWGELEETYGQQFKSLLDPLEEAVRRIDEYADLLSEADEAEKAAQREAEERLEAAAERRKRLEHDLRLSRERVRTLEQTLRQRTEELLQAQTVNNELAARLNAVADEFDGALQDA